MKVTAQTKTYHVLLLTPEEVKMAPKLATAARLMGANKAEASGAVIILEIDKSDFIERFEQVLKQYIAQP